VLDVTLETLQTVFSNVKAEYKAATFLGYITERISFSFSAAKLQRLCIFLKIAGIARKWGKPNRLTRTL